MVRLHHKLRSSFASALLIGTVLLQVGCGDVPLVSDAEPKQAPTVEVVTKTTDVPQQSPENEPAEQEPKVEVKHVASVPKAAQDRDQPTANTVRNVILVVGDGMGPQQLGMLFAYASLAPNSTVPDRTSAIELFSRQGDLALVRTEPYGALVVDSAASATQLATGEFSGSEMIGANYLGEPVPTVLEVASQHGKSTGLISDTRITHATPAAFAAHQTHRVRENEIALDLLENQVDVMLSAGLRYFVPEKVSDPNSAVHAEVVQMIGGAYKPSSKRTDNRNLLVEARKDYKLVFDRHAMERVTKGRVLGLFADASMEDATTLIPLLESEERKEPTLAEMTAKGLELLSQDPNGFFLMVEGGQIDWCGHNNDTGGMLHELLSLDAAVREIYRWAKDRDDTLVIITADHETGSFGFSYSGSPIPSPRALDGKLFEESKYAPQFNFAPPEVLDHLYAQRRSFFKVFLEFDHLPQEEKTPEKLLEMINYAIAPFSITLNDARQILTRMPNRQFAEGHRYLGMETVPLMPDQEAFYVFGDNGRMNHLGHIIGAQQNVVWGTGTHTNTPVALIASGPDSATSRFSGLMHMTDVGKAMIAVVKGE